MKALYLKISKIFEFIILILIKIDYNINKSQINIIEKSNIYLIEKNFNIYLKQKIS